MSGEFFDVDRVVSESHELGPHAAEQIAAAQDVYRATFELVDSEWPSAPAGPLGLHWNMIGEQSDTFLVNIASVLHQVSSSLTRKSQASFRDKLRQLLRPTNESTFTDVLTELEVAAALSTAASPVSFEPLVPEELHGSGSQPSSPDFGLLFPETLVTVEVTVWHWEALSVWTRMHQEVEKVFGARLGAREVRRSLQVELPYTTPQSAFTSIVSQGVCERIAAAETGMLSIPVDGHPSVTIRWSPLFHFDSDDTIDWEALSRNRSTSFTVGPAIDRAIAVSVNPCLDEADVEAAFESFRKSIDRKKRQSNRSFPFVLALGLNQSRIGWETLSPLIASRLWPNPKYGWLAAVGEVADTRVVPNFSGQRIAFNINPNGRPGLPNSMLRALRGEESFHRR